MKAYFVILLLCLVTLAVTENTCNTNQVYVKFRKQSSTWASEESWTISAGDTVLYTSPSLVNSQLREVETCISSTTNNQYTLTLKDSYGDSWTTGSWLEIQGAYGNIVFKNYLTASREEAYTLSLYNPIPKSATWKFTSGTVGSTWTALNFDTSSWTDITLGSTSDSVTGPHYYRYTFTGLTSMAAYEAQFNYRYGIVVYLNGNEIYRDNMPEGTVTSSTVATGSFSEYSYRGFIRPANELALNSVLAVEVHFLTADTSSSPDLNVWLSIYSSSVLGESCFIMPTTPTISSSDITNAANIFDFAKFNYATKTFSSSVTINIDYTEYLKPYINSVRAWPYTGVTKQPTSFSLRGTNSGTTYSSILSESNVVFTSSTYQNFYSYFNSKLYTKYQLEITECSSTTLTLYEWQLCICAISLPASIEFPQTAYSYYVNTQEANIYPTISGYSDCSISPALPSGLTLNTDTCSISGVATATDSLKTYTVSATINGNVYSGTFQLSIITCAGSLVEIERIYKTNPTYESFSIINADTEEVLYQVAANSGQSANTDVTSILCISAPRAGLDVDSSTYNYWMSGSYIYIHTLLDSASKETLLRGRFDTNLGLSTSYFFNPTYAIPSYQSWYYKMGEVPTNWYGSDTTGWTQGTAGSYPASTNTIQLYKKTFSISSLNNVAGFTISLKYKYGCVIYMNGIEVFRNGVSGDVSTSSSISNIYDTLMFRTISLPVKTMGFGSTSSQTYLQTGSNTIAIALVSIQDVTTSTFDCALNLMATDAVSRVFDYTTTSANAFDFYYGTTYHGTTCASSSMTIQFDNDRRECISSIIVQNRYNSISNSPVRFVVKGRNSGGEWTTLKTVTGLSWSLVGQTKKIWIENNTPYNQYSFNDFSDSDDSTVSSCSWYLSRIDMFVDNLNVNIPSLSYEPTSIYKNIEMGEVYPNSEYYYDFSVTPDLPSGIQLDPESGMISGTATNELAQMNYQISAKKVTGETVSAVFSLAVVICTDGKSLITAKMRTDSYPGECSYYLHNGRGTTGSIITSAGSLSLSSSFVYLDRCLNDGIYTFEVQDSFGDGWASPAGYMLTVDNGEMIFGMNMVPSATKPVIVSSVFSSYLPFQAEYSKWKVLKSATSTPTDWTTVSFDDATWSELKSSEIGTNDAVTTYIRKTFAISSLEDYQVLNIRMQYEGGVVVYFNGNKVARFNIDDTFSHDTTVSTIHDSTVFSKFHIVLVSAGAVEGNNVIAFEIHRPAEHSSANPVVFDATGVFGVEDCSPVLDTFSSLNGTASTATSLTQFFDMDCTTYGSIVNSVGSEFQWIVENLEGSRFNNYGILSSVASTGLGMSLYGREESSDDWTSMSAETGLSLLNRVSSSVSVPTGLINFKQFRWDIDAAGSAAPSVHSFFLRYCKATGDVCPGVDSYPPVAEGQISPSTCSYGFRGYSYRECVNGVLSEVKTDKCVYKLPSDLTYGRTRYNIVMDVKSEIPAPTYNNIITRFYMDEDLPEGLILDEKTGSISGMATKETSVKAYTIFGENPVGVTSITLAISVRKGECLAEGIFETTEVGNVFTYNCALQGNYVGSQKRACILGAEDGEWQKATGACMSVSMIVILVVIAIVVFVFVIFFIHRAGSKAKAVGGVKGKKSSRKSSEKKASIKAVKV